MQFRIADTFTDSLTRLTNDEQKAAKITALDLQLDPSSPGLKFHKLNKVKDKNFWSVRVGRDVRLIVHRSSSSLLLCYVDHHDAAYEWASRRKLETHPKTGAAQLVELRQSVREQDYVPTNPTVPVESNAQEPEKAEKTREALLSSKRALFDHLSDDELLGYGVPPEWLSDVRRANEDSLLELADHLPAEAAEALLEIATGGQPAPAVATPKTTDPFDHPDAQRRFRTLDNAEELAVALEYPWEKWTIFLHPTQRQIVANCFNGPARVSGSAGTGKTIVALHRAAHLARSEPEARVLLTTFSDTLAHALENKLHRLIGHEPRLGERIEVHAIDAIGQHLYEKHIGPLRLANRTVIQSLLNTACKSVQELPVSERFVLHEWEEVVDAWQLQEWKDYRDVKRLGRKTRLPETQRVLLWQVFEQIKADLQDQGLITRAGMFNALASHLQTRRHPVFSHAVVDEAQDISVAQLRFLSAMVGEQPQGLFFAGDLGQRIFQTPFSWKSLGVDVRGRSRTLRINYRTSHQIRGQADRLLGNEVADVDGNFEDRRGTVSVFNGPRPRIEVFDSEDDEIVAVGDWLKGRIDESMEPRELGVFVRTEQQIKRAQAAIDAAGLTCKALDERQAPTTGQISVSTMHLAKGLEFRAVVVMACDDEILPLQSRIEAITDETDLQEVYDTERHMLYVACTRARDQLMVTAVEPASEFLDDLSGN